MKQIVEFEVSDVFERIVFPNEYVGNFNPNCNYGYLARIMLRTIREAGEEQAFRVTFALRGGRVIGAASL